MKKIILFASTKCGPCKMITPLLEQIKEEQNLDMTKYFIDTDEGQLQAMSYGIMAVPTIVKLDGDDVQSLIGYRPKKDLEEFLI
jgi:thioredoxin 1